MKRKSDQYKGIQANERAKQLQEKNKADFDERAREHIPEYILQLAQVRDLLDFTANGDMGRLPFEPYDYCMFASAQLVRSCSDLERALIRLGILPKDARHFTAD